MDRMRIIKSDGLLTNMAAYPDRKLKNYVVGLDVQCTEC